jgi:hypothetical protein
MNITLTTVDIADCEELHAMQIKGFAELLEHYRDFDTSPGAETLERVRRRMSNPAGDHYFICADDVKIGHIRIYRMGEDRCRLSQMFILP